VVPARISSRPSIGTDPGRIADIRFQRLDQSPQNLDLAVRI